MTTFSTFLPLIPGGIPCNRRLNLFHHSLSSFTGWKICDGSVFVVAGMCQFTATGTLCKSREGQPARRTSPAGALCPFSLSIATVLVFVLAGLSPSAEMQIPLQIKCLSWLSPLSNCFPSSNAYGDNG